MQRLFVALRPPVEVRAMLLAAMGGIGRARWQRDDQLHLTLRYIGEVDRHRAVDIHAALGSIRFSAFELALKGLGLFDRRGVPETLWAGVTPQEPVSSLHKKVDQALARVGISPDQRAFLPHITLARLNSSSGSVGHFLESSGGMKSPPFQITSFALVESRLAPDGAFYDDIETYRLS